MAMTCDLCNRRSKRLLCDPCADMIQRLARVHARMHQTELCIGKQMDVRARAEAERARAAALPIPTETK